MSRDVPICPSAGPIAGHSIDRRSLHLVAADEVDRLTLIKRSILRAARHHVSPAKKQNLARACETLGENVGFWERRMPIATVARAPKRGNGIVPNWARRVEPFVMYPTNLRARAESGDGGASPAARCGHPKARDRAINRDI
jgi:hypothetical protein